MKSPSSVLYFMLNQWSPYQHACKNFCIPFVCHKNKWHTCDTDQVTQWCSTRTTLWTWKLFPIITSSKTSMIMPEKRHDTNRLQGSDPPPIHSQWIGSHFPRSILICRLIISLNTTTRNPILECVTWRRPKLHRFCTRKYLRLGIRDGCLGARNRN